MWYFSDLVPLCHKKHNSQFSPLSRFIFTFFIQSMIHYLSQCLPDWVPSFQPGLWSVNCAACQMSSENWSQGGALSNRGLGNSLGGLNEWPKSRKHHLCFAWFPVSWTWWIYHSYLISIFLLLECCFCTVHTMMGISDLKIILHLL